MKISEWEWTQLTNAKGQPTLYGNEHMLIYTQEEQWTSRPTNVQLGQPTQTGEGQKKWQQ